MRGVFQANVSCANESGLASPGHTIIYITTPATCAIEILSAQMSNSTIETNEQLLGEIRTITTLGTPTATTLTPTKLEGGSAASACTVKGNVTASEPTTYTANSSVGKHGFSSLGAWLYQPTPEERMTVPPSTSIGLLLVGTLTAVTLEASITWREIG